MSAREDGRETESTLALPWREAIALDRTVPAWGRMARAVRAALATTKEACGAFEWVAFGYLGFLSALIVLFHRNLAHAPLFLALHAGVAGVILVLCLAARGRDWPAVRFARDWYPQAFFLFCFEELSYVSHLIFPGWFDRWTIAFDFAVTGVYPTVWLEQFARPALNDFMQMSYITYFFYLTILAALLYRREERGAQAGGSAGANCAFWAVMTSSVAAYTIGYAIAVFFPVESPYHALAAMQKVELTGGFFTSLIALIERFGRVHGAAFPSAHVSGALVALLGAWRYRRRLFWAYLPFFLCMLVSTVYGRYHYVADVAGGLVVGAAGFWLGHKLMGRRGAHPKYAAADRA